MEERYKAAMLRERLTPKEKIVMSYLERAFTNAEMVQETGLTLSTIKTHVSSIIAKRGVKSRFELRLDQPTVPVPAKAARRPKGSK